MSCIWWRSFEGALLLFALAAASCATMQVNPIPPPPPTAKLRVYVQPLTGEGKWGTPHEVYVQSQVRRVERFLERTGIYDVVGERDVRAVLGSQRIDRRQLEQDGWALARRIGEALHADYVMVMERIKQRGAVGGSDFLFVNVMINVGTGKVFEARTRIEGMTRGDREESRELVRMTYRNIFRSCKEDMLATAIRKGRGDSPAPPRPPATVPEAEKPAPSRSPAGAHAQAAVGQERTAATQMPNQEALSAAAKIAPDAVTALREPVAVPDMPGSGPIEPPRKDRGAEKLVVYDFEAAEQHRIAALILAEALREEVFKLKLFVLVNREDLQKVLEEMALQQTGLIDEKDAVRTGKGLAANQVVTGRLGLLGKTFVMQAKRVDVETFGTLGLASAKFTEGQEDEVLSGLSEFARSLAGTQ